MSRLIYSHLNGNCVNINARKVTGMFVWNGKTDCFECVVFLYTKIHCPGSNMSTMTSRRKKPFYIMDYLRVISNESLIFYKITRYQHTLLPYHNIHTFHMVFNAWQGFNFHNKICLEKHIAHDREQIYQYNS